MPSRRLAIRASHTVADQEGGHRYLRNGVIVIEGNTIAHVGRQFAGAVDETIDATHKIATPGHQLSRPPCRLAADGLSPMLYPPFRE
jgi:imidazolonepropionase-like amidohydrolase